jgi:4-hydroxybenzoate polyprenyltransferase
MFALIRIWNGLFAAAVCVCSFFIIRNDFELNYNDVALLSLGVFFLLAFANAHNDIIDFEIDKTNRPKRPLPSGKISLKTARITAFSCFFIAIILGLISGFEFALLFAIVGILCLVYNKFLKGLPLIGNFAVALLTTTPIIIPIIKFGIRQPVLLNLVFFAFMLTFAREVMKDIEDMEGDSTFGLKTFPILFGEKLSVWLVFICMFQCLTMLALFNPFLLVGVAPCLTLSIIFALLKKWRIAQNIIKITMIMGLIISTLSPCSLRFIFKF